MRIDISILAVSAPLLLLLLGLAFTVVIDPYIRREHRQIMLVIACLCLSLIVQNLVENALIIGRPRVGWRMFVSIYGYSVRPVILVLFLEIVQQKRKPWLQWALAGVNMVLYATSPVSHLCFRITENNHFMRGPLWPVCFVICGILLAGLLTQTILRWREAKKLEYLIPLSVVLSIIVSVALDYQVKEAEQPITFLTIAMIVGSVFYYIWLHLQFVREHERDLIAAQRIRIMVSQIQPHFLYNTIATFRALCRRDPERAAEVAEKFGVYLRQNLDSLDTEGPIPVEKELEHTRLYAEIEMVRFENIRVEYDIRDSSFVLPPLTIQPLVENAIRHGVRIREEGLVRVCTRRTAEGHEIIVSDNGIGFDTAAVEKADGRHIGIRNVRERVESMCSGTLRIESRPEAGTTVTICIPAEEGTAA